MTGGLSDQSDNGEGDGNFDVDCFYDASQDKICFWAERSGHEPSDRTCTPARFDTTDAYDKIGVWTRTLFVPHDTKSYDVSVCKKGQNQFRNKLKTKSTILF